VQIKARAAEICGARNVIDADREVILLEKERPSRLQQTLARAAPPLAVSVSTGAGGATFRIGRHLSLHSTVEF
jgi:hypothetical protein